MNAHPIQIHLLARVGDSDVINEIATIEQVLDANRQPGDSATAVARVTVDLAAALRATAAEVETTLQRADLIERMREAYAEAWEEEDRRAGLQVLAREPVPPHARSRAGILAALDVLEGRA